MSRLPPLLFLLACFCAAPAQGQARFEPELRVRGGYVGVEGEDRDGSRRSLHTLRARVQAGGRVALGGGVRLEARLATPLASDGEAPRLRPLGYAPGPGGAEPGDVVLDRLALGWEGGGVAVRVGRLQTNFTLPGLPTKSLLRYDSPSFNVHWTDGAHLRAPAPGGGRLHVLAIHTPPSGVATALRAPLRFEEGGRLGVFGAWEGGAAGPLSHRALHVLFHPQALPGEGGGLGAFAALGAQAVSTVPLRIGVLAVAGEGGWTPTPPARPLARVPGEGKAGPLAGQLTLTLRELGGGAHAVSLLAAATGSGWLTSADFRPNSAEVEGRYYWQVAPRFRLETRLRWREDLAPPLGAAQRRAEADAFIRLNYQL